MADYQNTVDRVRAFVSGVDQTRTDALPELANAFSDVCREANERLRRCIDYVRRGLRSEAIHLADAHPGLLEMVAALDIPEIEEWEQICAAYELARPARMMIESAQELNEAYALEQPLQHLLGLHRLLALGRAPLSERLAVIRELVSADPTNSSWTEDQEKFERVRLKELRGDVATAVLSEDVAVIDQLRTEISKQSWRVEIPADILGSLSNASWSLHAEKATLQLESMVLDIRSALHSRSYPQAKKLQAAWKKILTDFKFRAPPELEVEYAPLRQLIKDHETLQAMQSSFTAACSELRTLLDARAPEESLTAKYRAAQAIGLPIDQEIEDDYRIAIARLQRARRFEKIGMYTLVVAATFIIVLIVIVAIWAFARPGQ